MRVTVNYRNIAKNKCNTLFKKKFLTRIVQRQVLLLYDGNKNNMEITEKKFFNHYLLTCSEGYNEDLEQCSYLASIYYSDD